MARTCAVLSVVAATLAVVVASGSNETGAEQHPRFPKPVLRAASQDVVVPVNGRRTIELHNDLPIPDGHSSLLLPINVRTCGRRPRRALLSARRVSPNVAQQQTIATDRLRPRASN